MNSTREKVYVDRRPPAAKDNSATLTLVAAATVLALGAMALVFWLMAANAPAPQAEPEDGPPPPAVASPLPTPTPTPSAAASAAPTVPPAPPSNELVGNEWLLSPYAIRQDNGRLIVTGTLQNLASEARSAHVSVFVYVSGSHIATATGTVENIAAGDSIPVSLPSDAQWQPGDKVLLVVAQDEAPAGSEQAQALP